MKNINDLVVSAKEYAYDDSHGYSQSERYGPDYDCSSLIRQILIDNGFNVSFTWTGNELADLLNLGFVDVKDSVNLATGNGVQEGDILLYHNSGNNNGHTAIVSGRNKIIHASSNELGGVTGGKTGDQNGKEICETNYFNFPWQHVLRYMDKTEESDTIKYVVQKYDTLWSISNRFGVSIEEICRLNNIQNKNLIYENQVLIIKENKKEEEELINPIEIEVRGGNINNVEKVGNVIYIYIE